MRDFGDWVNANAASIPDNSVIKGKIGGNNFSIDDFRKKCFKNILSKGGEPTGSCEIICTLQHYLAEVAGLDYNILFNIEHKSLQELYDWWKYMKEKMS